MFTNEVNWYNIYEKRRVMEEAVKILRAVAEPLNMRIIKLLTKKMCTDFELAEVLKTDISVIHEKTELLKNAGIVSIVNDGKYMNYFVKASSSVFNKYASDVLNMLSKWFNSDADVIADYTKVRMLDRERTAEKYKAERGNIEG